MLHVVSHYEPTEEQELTTLEDTLFTLGHQMEIIWLDIGRICSEIEEKKLYRFRQDENGNYFRTAKGYFTWLDTRFREKGWNLSRTSLNRFIADHRLYERDLQVPQEDILLLGKSALNEMAPTVRKLQKEQGEEAAKEFVQEVVAAARANDGLPLIEVRRAVDDVTGRVTKGLEATFVQGMFGYKLSAITLYWGDRPINLLSSEVTQEQMEWVQRRLGIKPSAHLP